MATLITKNSSTAAAVPGAGDIVQGELAVNVADKRLFTKDAGGTVVEVGTNPSSLIVDGNVGVGVTPSAWSVRALQLTGSPAISTVNGIDITYNAFYDGAWKYVGTARALHYSQAASSGEHRWFTAPSGTAGNAISFTQTMTLDASGNLGVGTTTTSPYRFNVLRADGNAAFFTDGSTADLYIKCVSGVTTLSPTTGVLAFGTSSTERARITSGGDLLVGTTSLAGAGGISFQSQSGTGFAVINNNNAGATGYVFQSFRRSSTEIGSVTQNGTTAVLFNTTSDRRLKDNIVPAPSASDVIDAIEIVSHDWKSAPDEHVTYGVIAQDLAVVAPQAVLQGDDGDEIEKTWGVDYSKLVPMLIKEIQSLRDRVAALETP